MDPLSANVEYFLGLKEEAGMPYRVHASSSHQRDVRKPGVTHRPSMDQVANTNVAS